MSGGNTEKQIMIMMDFKATFSSPPPSYAMHLGSSGRKRIGPDDIP
jgi:phenylacetate-coenzyme A ligase PaaK-like adenylate-forming protein